MRLLRRLAHWWRFKVHGEEREEELSFHREKIRQDLIAQGMPAAEAETAARRRMGNATRMREESRGVWLWPSLEAIGQDEKVTLRSLRASPAFTTGVMLTFALGVGANAAMFSLVDRLMLRPPPRMRDAASVHRVYLYRMRDGMERQTGGQYPRHADLVRFTSSFSAIAAHSLRRLAVGVGQDAREMPIGVVSATFFTFFEAPPAAGRYFGAAEDGPAEAAPVAVLSYATWQARYAGRDDAIGSSLHIGSSAYTIVGVAPKGFVGLWPFTPPAAFIPVSTYAASTIGADWRTNYGSAFGLGTIVRLRPGVTIEAASADLSQALRASYVAQGSADRLAELRPRALAGSILPERGPERSSAAKVALWLAGVTTIVLLIACANVASLLLARALARPRDTALRLALGVGRTRLPSQLFTESMLLAVAGSMLGIAVGTWMTRILGALLIPGAQPPAVASDPRTLAYLGIVTLAVGSFTGLIPMLQARGLSLANELKSGGRTNTHHRSRARGALLVFQVALALVLLVGAGLFVRSLDNVRHVRLGFDADSVLVVQLKMRDVKLDSVRTVALRERLLEAATTVPGIEHASMQFAVPMAGMASWPISVPGVDSVEALGEFELNSVSPDYFGTMGTRIVRGRGFQRRAVAAAARA